MREHVFPAGGLFYMEKIWSGDGPAGKTAAGRQKKRMSGCGNRVLRDILKDGKTFQAKETDSVAVPLYTE